MGIFSNRKLNMKLMKKHFAFSIEKACTLREANTKVHSYVQHAIFICVRNCVMFADLPLYNCKWLFDYFFVAASPFAVCFIANSVRLFVCLYIGIRLCVCVSLLNSPSSILISLPRQFMQNKRWLLTLNEAYIRTAISSNRFVWWVA